MSGVVYSFKMVDPVLFVFEFQVLYCIDLEFFLITSLLILSSLDAQPLKSEGTILHILKYEAIRLGRNTR
jgi:hypothetical protein